MEEDIEDFLTKKFEISFRVKKIKDIKNGIMVRILFEDYSIMFYYIKNFTFNYNMDYLQNQIKRIRNGEYNKKGENKNDA